MGGVWLLLLVVSGVSPQAVNVHTQQLKLSSQTRCESALQGLTGTVQVGPNKYVVTTSTCVKISN